MLLQHGSSHLRIPDCYENVLCKCQLISKHLKHATMFANDVAGCKTIQVVDGHFFRRIATEYDC